MSLSKLYFITMGWSFQFSLPKNCSGLQCIMIMISCNVRKSLSPMVYVLIPLCAFYQAQQSVLSTEKAWQVGVVTNLRLGTERGCSQDYHRFRGRPYGAAERFLYRQRDQFRTQLKRRFNLWGGFQTDSNIDSQWGRRSAFNSMDWNDQYHYSRTFMQLARTWRVCWYSQR